MATTRRGRPPKKERLVPLMVMVREPVKNYLTRAAEVQEKSLSQYAREILDHFYETR